MYIRLEKMVEIGLGLEKAAEAEIIIFCEYIWSTSQIHTVRNLARVWHFTSRSQIWRR
jgi:hypothetical protein